MEIKEKDFYTTSELAGVLKISRISVLKRVGNGSIKGRKMGRNYVIFKKDIDLNKLKSIIKH
jgi:excisionase family DNA binding protein